MLRFIAVPISLAFIVGAVALARSLRRRSFLRRAHELTPVSEQWLADRRRSD
jgi:hypothetical protein